MTHKLTSRSRPTPREIARSIPLGELLSLGAQLNADVTPSTLLREVAEAVTRVLGFRRAHIRLRNAETDELEAVAFAGLSEQEQADLKASPIAPGSYQALLQERFRIGDFYYIPHDANVEAEPALARGRSLSPPGWRPGQWHPHDHLLAPLRGRSDRLIGILYLSAPDDRKLPGETALAMLSAIVRQAALSLENARLYARTARLLTKEQLLAELGRDVSATLDLRDILVQTGERLASAFPAGTIVLIDERRGLSVAHVFGAESVPLKLGPFEQAICERVISQGAPFFSTDVEADLPLLTAQTSAPATAHSFIAVPLRAGGYVIGVLCVHSPHLGRFTYEDVDLLEAVASQVGGPIASARLYAALQRRNDQLTVLNAVARTAAATLELERLVADVTAEIQQGFRYDNVQLFLLDEDGQYLRLAAQAGEILSECGGLPHSLSEGLIGKAARLGRTVLVDDVHDDPDYVESPRSQTRSELCVPVQAASRVLGVLNLESGRLGAFTEGDVAALETAADVLAGAIENVRLYRRAQEAAVLEERTRLARDLHDSVTQQLFSIALTAQAARAQLEKRTDRAATQIERLQETAAAALAEMRGLIFQLRPPAALERGLVPALQQHIAAVRRRDGLPIELRVEGEGEGRLPHRAEQGLYRIAQEALNNVARHAGECYVVVAVRFDPEQVRLEIEDTGRGFDYEQALARGDDSLGGRRLGLIGMRERAAELGASFHVESRQGLGTRVIVELART
jgi:signal transduction histidine kinase